MKIIPAPQRIRIFKILESNIPPFFFAFFLGWVCCPIIFWGKKNYNSYFFKQNLLCQLLDNQWINKHMLLINEEASIYQFITKGSGILLLGQGFIIRYSDRSMNIQLCIKSFLCAICFSRQTKQGYTYSLWRCGQA